MNKPIKRKTDSQSVNELLDAFINKKRLAGLAPRTVDDYNDLIHSYINETNANTLDDISEAQLFSYINDLKERGITDSSINNKLSAIRVFLYDLMNDKKIAPFKITLIKRQEKGFKLYTDEELAKLVAKPSKKAGYVECRTYTIICLILATGARASTVINIHHEDVDFINKQIGFRHMKTRQALVVPLSDSLSTILREFINEWDIESDFLFADVTGNKMSYNALRLGVDRYCRRRGVAPKGIHSLRHNFARGWVMNNGNMFQLQRVLGHSTLEMSRKYVRLFSDDLKDSYENYSLLDTINKSRKWAVSKS